MSWMDRIGPAGAPREGRDPVAAAFARIRREDFLPPEVRDQAGEDVPLGIGHGQTNSQPSTVENMLRLLDPRPGHRVLDVGAGSGWTSALLGAIVGPDGAVVGTELVPQLTERAREANRTQDQPWVQIRQAEAGVLGAPDDPPFDRILVSAMAEELPASLVEQLTTGGVLVVPVAGEMLRVTRGSQHPDGIEVTRHGAYRFVPLHTD